MVCASSRVRSEDSRHGSSSHTYCRCPRGRMRLAAIHLLLVNTLNPQPATCNRVQRCPARGWGWSGVLRQTVDCVVSVMAQRHLADSAPARRSWTLCARSVHSGILDRCACAHSYAAALMMPAVPSASPGDTSSDTLPSDPSVAAWAGRTEEILETGVPDRLIENRRIRRQPRHWQIADIAAQCAAGQQPARDVVEPWALAEIVQLLYSVHDFSGPREQEFHDLQWPATAIPGPRNRRRSIRPEPRLWRARPLTPESPTAILWP